MPLHVESDYYNHSGVEIFSHFFVFRREGKIIFTFFHMATEKKFQEPVVACLKRLILDPDVFQAKIFHMNVRLRMYKYCHSN